MTKRLVFNQDPRVSLSYGMVDLYTELKSTHQEIRLIPSDKPIVVRFEKKQASPSSKDLYESNINQYEEHGIAVKLRVCLE